MTVRVATLPRFQAFVDDREIESLQARRKPAGLLLYLALERSATRDTLVSLFWPDHTDERARRTLNQLIYELKQDIGEDWLDSRGSTLVVRATVETDVAAFERAVEQRRYAEALELYGGNLLEGLHLVETSGFESWLDLRRAQVGRLHRKARRELIANLIQTDDLQGALRVAIRWSELEPQDDEAQQRTIELLARTGRRNEAIRQFETFEEALRRDELEPLPQLRELMVAIRSGAFEVTPTGSVPPTPSPLIEPKPSRDDGSLPGLPPDLKMMRSIAEGAAARVYLARQTALGRMVAVKVPTPASMRDPVAVRRFEREARAVARIQHPNVTPIFGVGTLADGTPYIVLQYVSGGSLEDHLAATGPIAEAEVRRTMAQIASGLAAVHRLGIVHRDLRPANVLCDRDADRVLITDFGTAALIDSGDADQVALTRPGDRLGLPAYSSPEQLRGEPVTERSDVYSLGVLGFELLTGELPFQATTPFAMTTAHLTLAPRTVKELRPEVDPAFDQLINRCLNKRPEQRPFAREVASALGA